LSKNPSTRHRSILQPPGARNFYSNKSLRNVNAYAHSVAEPNYVTSVTDNEGSAKTGGKRGSSNKNSMKSHLRNRRGYTREKTSELQKTLHKVDTYQQL